MPLFVKSIRPLPIKPERIRLEILNALRKEGTVQKKLLRQTTAHWSGDKPTFTAEISLTGGDANLLVGPIGNTMGVKKWVWTDEGTKPHIIRPKRARALRFRSGYKSGSRPGTFVTGRSSYSGGWVSAQIVHHPGTKARNWSSLLLKERFLPFNTAMNAAVRNGIKKG